MFKCLKAAENMWYNIISRAETDTLKNEYHGYAREIATSWAWGNAVRADNFARAAKMLDRDRDVPEVRWSLEC